MSVVVAARNASTTLPACLRSLRALDYPDVELIVVDDGSTDDSEAIARAAGARVLSSRGRGPSAARNLGVAHATHEIVAFTDADCTVECGWLRAFVAALRTTHAAGVGGPQRNVFMADARDAKDLDAFFSLASLVAEYTRADQVAGEVTHNASCNSAYIKHTILEAGGFAQDLFPGEDVDLDYRIRKLGYRCYYVPEARVNHYRPGTRAWFAGMMRRYGQAQRALVEKHGRFRALHYAPAATSAVLLAQLLWLPRRARSYVGLLDAALVAGAVALLAARVPPARWAAVLDYSVLAVVQWHRGYWEGLRPHP